MTEPPFVRFATAYHALSRNADEGAIDRLVAPHFQLVLDLAPDIIRGAVRRAVDHGMPPSALWNALRAMEQDIAALPPSDRHPPPRPFAAPRTGVA
ncbi:MAG: hypothetical protein RMM58_06605 [Chloroflexota bacterium]|nr:hypothetical protein [Dehalococcoidia bacterium]MDW8253532.1 hypothetical protein [Chloroflexota bacterium]